jgi:hypothetical protein
MFFYSKSKYQNFNSLLFLARGVYWLYSDLLYRSGELIFSNCANDRRVRPPANLWDRFRKVHVQGKSPSPPQAKPTGVLRVILPQTTHSDGKPVFYGQIIKKLLGKWKLNGGWMWHSESASLSTWSRPLSEYTSFRSGTGRQTLCVAIFIQWSL